jgi:branched-chain amino acid transport system permease protein
VIGYLLGRLTLRLRGAYFVLVTVGFAEVIRLVATNWTDLTQGPMGLPGVPAFAVGLERFTLVEKRDYYYLMVVLAGVTLWLTARLLTSRVGRALSAIRENEPGRVLGIGAYRHPAGPCRGVRAGRGAGSLCALRDVPRPALRLYNT